jgi:GTP-binding protein
METNLSNPEFIRGYQTADDIIGFFKNPPNPDPMAGIAFIGRSNVGKSSLINALFNHKIAHVSNTPGRTQQINVFTFKLRTTANKELGEKSKLLEPIFYCFDLPGYGHASVSKDMKKLWQELIDAFFQNIPETINLINIQDARHPFTENDEVFFDYLKSYQLRPILVLNKMDKLKTQKERAKLDAELKIIMKKAKLAKQFYFTSVEKRQGIEELHRSLTNGLVGLS